MTPEQFAYWLQGFAELSPTIPPNPTQWKQIQDHLQTVFKKITPSYPTTTPGIKDPTTINPKPWWEWKPDPIPAYPSTPSWKPTEIICQVGDYVPNTPYCSVTSPMNMHTNTSNSGNTYDVHIKATQHKNLVLNRKRA